MVKEEKPRVEGCTKPKGSHFQKLTSTKKDNSKALSAVLEDKVFNFGKEKHAAELMEKCEVISNLIAVNYKHGGTGLVMDTKNMEKPPMCQRYHKT